MLLHNTEKKGTETSIKISNETVSGMSVHKVHNQGSQLAVAKE